LTALEREKFHQGGEDGYDLELGLLTGIEDMAA